jgi:hypothetical protein
VHVNNPLTQSVLYEQLKIIPLCDLNLNHDCSEVFGDQSSENGVGVQRFVEHMLHDHPLYLVCPDMLILVRELLSADGVVRRITYSFRYY